MISDRPQGSARDAGQRVFLGDPKSAGYRRFRAGIAEYLALLPPNSHGEANPADKDPVPPPFDNTYNSPEHDAFVHDGQVPAQRRLLHEEHRRRRRSRAARPGLERPVRVVAVPRRLPGHALGSLRREAGEPQDRGHDAGARWRRCPRRCRPHVRSLRAHYDAVIAGARRCRARPRRGRPRRSPAAPGGGRSRRPRQVSLRAFYDTCAGRIASTTTRPCGRCSPAS